MRSGGEYFTNPSEPAQRRYEALRAYFVDELSAAEVAARFGYSPQVVHQMASELRAGKARFFASSKPGPKGPRKTGRIRDRVLELRAQDRSVTEIAQAAELQQGRHKASHEVGGGLTSGPDSYLFKHSAPDADSRVALARARTRSPRSHR